MRKILYIACFASLFPFLVEAQTPKKIHDLKSLTDSTGTVHLFYRIYAEHEGTEYFTNNIYHYNTKTGEEELFLEDYYDRRYGFVSDYYISDYDFFENNPNKYIYIGGYDSEVGYIQRYDTLAFEGFLTFPYKLFATGDDSSMVYVSFNYISVKSFDGGITWPESQSVHEENIPDSLKLNFPLTSLSPYDDSLMFGGSDSFFRSINAGLTNEEIEIYPNNEKLHYDSDSVHIYALSYFISEDKCMPDECEHSLYSSSIRGKSGSWKEKKTFYGEKQIYAHPENSGELYIWGKDSIFVSKNYGENFDLLYKIDEEITGFSIEGEQVFIATISSLYKLKNNQLILLREIPVSIEERDFEVPSEITLYQNYPNPFNPSTVIRFRLSQPAQVSLKIYDVVGNLVQTLISEGILQTGEHQYKWNAGSFSSGVYFYRLDTGQEVLTKKMILIK